MPSLDLALGRDHGGGKMVCGLPMAKTREPAQDFVKGVMSPSDTAFAEIEDRSQEVGADWPFIPVTSLLTAVWVLFSWPWLSGAVTIPWDAKAHFAPQVQFMAASFARGELPFWNPFAFSGHPQIADPQAMIFSPPMLLLALTNPSPSLWAIDTVVLAMLLFGGIGVLWLARDLEWHWAAALVAAIAFAFGAAMAWRLQHFGQVFSLAYFPWALVLLRRALDRGSIGYGMLAGLVSAFIVLGRDQVALLCVYMLIGFVGAQWFAIGLNSSRLLRTLPPLLAGGALGIALIALPILMTTQLAAMSNRPSIDFAGAGAGSLHPALLVTSAIPHLFGAAGEMADYWGPPSFTWENTGLFIAQNMGLVYIGAITLIALAAGTVHGWFFHRDARYLLAAFAFVLLYGLGWYTPVFKAAYEILPGVDYYRRPADAVFAIGGMAGLLAGYAVNRLLRAIQPTFTRSHLAGTIVLVLLPFALSIAFASHFGRLDQATLPILQAAGWFAVAAASLYCAIWLRPIRPVFAGLLITAPLAADIAINNGPNGASALPAAALEMLETNSPNETVRALQDRVAAATNDTHRPRVELYGLGFHWPNASLSHRLENTLGYNPVRLQIYSQATGAGDTSGLPGQRKVSPLFPSYRSRLADMLGLRYIATGEPIEKVDRSIAPGSWKPVARTKAGYIYENAGALPRVLFATTARSADFATLIKTGAWPEFDPETTVLLEDITRADRNRQPGKARIVDYRNTRIVIETNSPDGGWLVLNDIWHPWWKATLNGTPVEVHRANVIFRAVKVGSGRQNVTFTFSPVAASIAQLTETVTDR